jgi:hypothetical protein
MLCIQITDTGVLTTVKLEVLARVAQATANEEMGGGPETLDGPRCRHQWVIETPSGPASKGVCMICGDERDFQNYIEGSSWGYDISLEQLAGGSRYPTGAARRGGSSDDD